MSVRPRHRSRLTVTGSLILALGAGQALATGNLPDFLFPALPPATDGTVQTPVTPPVLRVQPLIQLRWAEIFGASLEAAGRTYEHSTAVLPPSPMYRRDI